MKGERLQQERTDSRPRTRTGVRINVYLKQDADTILDRLAERNGCTRTEVLEQALYDAWFLSEARENGEKVLLYDKKGHPRYREVVFNRRACGSV